MASTRRQPDAGPPLRTLHAHKRRGDDMPLHAHDEAQLIFPASGVMRVHTAAGRWLVPPQLAVWVPARVAHRVEVLADAELWMIYWRPRAALDWAPAPGRAFALPVTPLLRALIPAAFAQAPSARLELVARLVLHEVAQAPDAPTFLPWPAGTIGRRVAGMALADHRHRLDLAALASRAATSARTVSRLFPVETGLTFKAWRQRARIVRAIDRLAGGRPIARVAAEAGFSSTAAFSFAFRQVTAMTPTAFLGRASEDGRRVPF